MSDDTRDDRQAPRETFRDPRLAQYPELRSRLERLVTTEIDRIEAEKLVDKLQKLELAGYEVSLKRIPSADRQVEEAVEEGHFAAKEAREEGRHEGKREVRNAILDALPLAGILTGVVLLGTYGRGLAAGITTVRQLGLIGKLKFLLGDDR